MKSEVIICNCGRGSMAQVLEPPVWCLLCVHVLQACQVSSSGDDQVEFAAKLRLHPQVRQKKQAGRK